MPRASGSLTLIVTCLLSSTLGLTQVNTAELLDQATALIDRDAKDLPRFTCSESVERSYYVERTLELLRSDRFRLDFAVFRGRRLFSWSGATSFYTALLAIW